MSDSEERLVRGYNGRLLVAISIGWMAIQAGRLAIGPLVPTIKTSLDISSTQVGFAITVIWGLYAILQYPSGRLSDNLTRKTLLVVGLVSLSGGFVLLASATTYGVFLVGAVVIGAGAGLYPTAARALVSDLYVRKRGAAYGIHTASGDLGGVIAAGLAAVVVGAVAWQFTFVPVILSLLSVAAVLHVFSREAYEFSWVDLEIKTTLRRLLTSIQFRWLLVGYSLYAFTWQATTGFLPAYLELGKGFAPIVAKIAFAFLFGVGVVIKPVAGRLGDIFSRKSLSAIVLIIAGIALSGVILSASPIIAVVAVIVFAAGLMAFPPLMQAYLMDSFPTESAGGDLGATRAIYIGVGSLGPTYVGVIADVFSYDLAFVGLVGGLFLSAGIIIFGS